jgi:hypothetical protein
VINKSGLLSKDPDRSGLMTSSVLCADIRNEVSCGGIPGKMTETFQDVSTLKCSSRKQLQRQF